jgi:hypothetical protein
MMSLYDVLQVTIVGGAIFASTLYAFGRVVPGARKRCASWLSSAGQPRWLQYMGAKMAGGGGCGDGCGTCNSCGPTSKVVDDRAPADSRKIPVDHL